MPPKAVPKEKPAKGDEAEELVAQYLKSVNRPYASTDVAANLKGKVPKPMAQKIMLTLAEKGTLTKKDYGKQSIFVYNQALLDRLGPEEIAVLDNKRKEVQTVLDEKRKQLKAIQTDLSHMMSLPKTKDLAKAIESVKSENTATLNALLPYRGEGGVSSIKPLDDDEIKKIDEDWMKWRKEWEKRRKVYKELLGMVSDGGGISDVNEFQEEQGITLDDDEATAVEKGEFAQPPPPIRKQMKPVKQVQVQAVAKRTASTASDPDEGGKKKKAKKA